MITSLDTARARPLPLSTHNLLVGRAGPSLPRSTRQSKASVADFQGQCHRHAPLRARKRDTERIHGHGFRSRRAGHRQVRLPQTSRAQCRRGEARLPRKISGLGHRQHRNGGASRLDQCPLYKHNAHWMITDLFDGRVFYDFRTTGDPKALLTRYGLHCAA